MPVGAMVNNPGMMNLLFVAFGAIGTAMLLGFGMYLLGKRISGQKVKKA